MWRGDAVKPPTVVTTKVMTYEQPLHAPVGDHMFDLIVVLYRNVICSCKLQGIYSTMEKVGYEWARSLVVVVAV